MCYLHKTVLCTQIYLTICDPCDVLVYSINSIKAAVFVSFVSKAQNAINWKCFLGVIVPVVILY